MPGARTSKYPALGVSEVPEIMVDVQWDEEGHKLLETFDFAWKNG